MRKDYECGRRCPQRRPRKVRSLKEDRRAGIGGHARASHIFIHHGAAARHDKRFPLPTHVAGYGEVCEGCSPVTSEGSRVNGNTNAEREAAVRKRHDLRYTILIGHDAVKQTQRILKSLSTFAPPVLDHDATIHSRFGSGAARIVNTQQALKMYTTSWFGDCRAAKRFLSEKNIPYEEINIEDVDGAAEIVMQLNQGRRSVPTFDIDGQFINCSPFDRRKLSAALGLN